MINRLPVQLNTLITVQWRRLGIFPRYHSLKFKIFKSRVGLPLHICIDIYAHHSLKDIHISACQCTHTHKQRRGCGWNSLKNTGGTSSSVFSGTSSRNKTAGFMADQRKTHKQTCSVLRHVDKWRFLIVMHDVLMWFKKKKSLQKHQETAPWTDLEQKVFVDKRSVCFNPLGLPMVAERVSVVANSLEAFYVSLLRKFSYFLVETNDHICLPAWQSPAYQNDTVPVL